MNTVRLAIRDLERIGLRIGALSATPQRIAELENEALVAIGYVHGEPPSMDRPGPLYTQKTIAGIPLTVREK